MVVPLTVRCVAAAFGAALILMAWASAVGTLIVPRQIGSWLTRWVDRVVVAAYQFLTRDIMDFRRLDRVLATQAAAILVIQLFTWMAIAFFGFTLLLWPWAATGIASAFSDAGSSMFTLGYNEPAGAWPAAVVFCAAVTGLVIVALQIGYLPTLYSAFNRRETEVALLNARSGVPNWGPELLSRTHYALGSGTSTVDTLPDLYSRWERWAADVAESHTTYLPLVRFRSPRPFSSWVIALLAVLDSAAMYLALSPVAILAAVSSDPAARRYPTAKPLDSRECVAHLSQPEPGTPCPPPPGLRINGTRRIPGRQYRHHPDAPMGTTTAIWHAVHTGRFPGRGRSACLTALPVPRHRKPQTRHAGVVPLT